MRRSVLPPVAPLVTVLVAFSGVIIGQAQEAERPRGKPTAGEVAPSVQDAQSKPGWRSSGPQAGAKLADAKREAVLRPLRSTFGRALASKNRVRREAKLHQAVRAVTRQLDVRRNDPELTIELLSLLARIQMELGDLAAAKLAVQRQQRLAINHLGTPGFATWLTEQVNRMRNLAEFDLAIFHFSESVKDRPESELAAQRSLLIGDILVQRAYPSGPYDEAIIQYARVAERYRASFPDLSDDARLRQAKICWRSGRIEEAKRLFTDLTRTGNTSVAEEARHYPEIMELRQDSNR